MMRTIDKDFTTAIPTTLYYIKEFIPTLILYIVQKVDYYNTK